MAQILNVDHKTVAAIALATTTGVAIFSTYKLMRLRGQKKKKNVYETQKLLHEYLVFHYGSAKEVLQYDFGPKDSLDFPKRCADLCLKYYVKQEGVPHRALDVGCAVGRSTFELSDEFAEVVGVDYSHSFIDACKILREKAHMDYYVTTVGELCDNLEAKLNPRLPRERTVFMQGDACNLPLDLGQFGCVLAANLICRLHRPQSFLDRCANLVAPGGILVITSPYTFLEEYTPKENMLGGYKTADGQEITGFEGLKHHLGEFFDLIADQDMPFFIRETARKNQWTVAHATVWKRKQ